LGIKGGMHFLVVNKYGLISGNARETITEAGHVHNFFCCRSWLSCVDSRYTRERLYANSTELRVVWTENDLNTG